MAHRDKTCAVLNRPGWFKSICGERGKTCPLFLDFVTFLDIVMNPCRFKIHSKAYCEFRATKKAVSSTQCELTAQLLRSYQTTFWVRPQFTWVSGFGATSRSE